jgi:hypothetical protein
MGPLLAGLFAALPFRGWALLISAYAYSRRARPGASCLVREPPEAGPFLYEHPRLGGSLSQLLACRWQLTEAGHSTPEAPHTPAAGHRGMVRLPRKQNRAPALRATWTPAPSTHAHARFATCARRRTHGGEPKKTEHRRSSPWDLGRKERARGSALCSGPQATRVWRLAASGVHPPDCGGGGRGRWRWGWGRSDVSASLAARGESSGHAQIAHLARTRC